MLYCCHKMSVWMSHTGIVLKQIKLSNFSLSLVAPPLWFSNTAYGCEILTGREACHSGGLRNFWSENTLCGSAVRHWQPIH